MYSMFRRGGAGVMEAIVMFARSRGKGGERKGKRAVCMGDELQGNFTNANI